MKNASQFGPALYRLCAILMVVGANAMYLLQWHVPAVAQFAPITGFLGLEAFFVLAGFWLAQKLYPIYSSENFGWNVALQFVKKRLCRIMPLYWLVLLVNIVLAVQMDYQLPQVWRYFLLLQNVSTPIPAFFPESWGLPIIVFTLLLFPILLAAFHAMLGTERKRLLFPLLSVALIALFVWAKWLFNQSHHGLAIGDWENKVRTVLLYRVDAVCYGILAGWLVQVVPLYRWRWLLALCALAGIGFLAVGVGFLHLNIETHPFFWNVLYLPIASVVLALCLMAVHFGRAWPKWLKPFAVIDGAAYSIYLVHFSIALLLFEHFVLADLPQFTVSKVVGVAVAYFIMAVCLGLMVYLGVEKPLRKRLKC